MITTNTDGDPISQAFAAAMAEPSVMYSMKLLRNGSDLGAVIKRAKLDLGAGQFSDDLGTFAACGVYQTQFSASLYDCPSILGDELEVRVGVLTGNAYEYVAVAHVTITEESVWKGVTDVRGVGRMGLMHAPHGLAEGDYQPAAVASAIYAATGIVVSIDARLTTQSVHADAGGTCRDALESMCARLGAYACELGEGVSVMPYSSTVTGTIPTGHVTRKPELGTLYEVDGITVEAGEESFVQGTGRVHIVDGTATATTAAATWGNMRGYAFTPATLNIALIDPRWTVADMLEVTLGEDDYSIPARGISITYDGGYFGTISAAGLTAEAEEMTVEGPLTRSVGYARSVADEALEVAQATGQYFWHDTAGAHVSTEAFDPVGNQNTLWNTEGMLFRKETTNLLAIVTSNTGGNATGISIYDGQGNDAENIVASFTNDGVTVGASDKNSMSLGATSMTMLDGEGGTMLEIAPSSASSRKNLSNSFDGVMPTQGNSVTLHLATVPDLSIRSISCRWDVKVGGGSAHTLSANFTSFGTTIPFNENRYVLNVTPNSDGTVTIENISSTAVMPELSKFTFVYSGNGVAPYYRFGNGTSAITGAYGFSHGSDCYPQADNSMASGEWCVAQAPEQHVFGRCNAIDNTSALIIGNGTGSTAAERSNAMTVDWDGNETLAGGLTLGSPLTIANGGTGATTASNAWDALGGGDIGKKDSLAASDIPSLDYTTVDSSTALVDAGNNAKTITAQYSGNAVAATDYVTMWGNYKLVAVTIANLWSKLVSTGIKLKDAIINRDAANPTSAQWSGKEITFQDVDGERIAFVNVKRNTNGSIELCVSAENESTSGGDLYNSLNMAIARDGTKSYSVSDAAAFRTAIGVGTIGTKNSLAASDIPSLAASKITSGTLGIARGGTGSSSVTSKLNNTNATIYIWGKLVMVQLHGQAKAPDGTAIWSTAYLSDYKPGYNVSAIVAATTGELARVWVSASDGKVYLSAVNTSTSKAWYGTLVYMLA